MTNSARNTQNLTNIENTTRIATRASNFETRRFILSAGLREILENFGPRRINIEKFDE